MMLRSKLILILTATLVIALTETVVAQDSTTVRIRVDVDGVRLLIDSVEHQQDTYGNPLTVQAWFILQMELGDYRFEFNHDEYESIVRQESLVAGEVKTFDLKFIVDTVPEGEGLVRVASLPDSAEISINDQVQLPLTPAEFLLSGGQHKFELVREGFEPLSHDLFVQPDVTVSLNFRLISFPPAVLTEESMNLVKMPTQVPVDMALADQQLTKYTSMAETFAVIPFGQGVMGKILLDGEDQATADALIISGAVLSIGSYIIGKLLSNKKRKWIITENTRIERENILAKDANYQIDIAVRQANAEAVLQWEEDNRNTGEVEVTIEDE